MMHLGDVLQKFEDPSFVRKLALKYIKHGEFSTIETLLKIEQGVLEALFYEYSSCDEAFNRAVRQQGQKRLQRQAVPKIFDLIKSLSDITECTDETVGGAERLRAATVLGGMLHKLAALDSKEGQKDDLDDLWEELGNERSNTSKDDKNMQ